MSTEKRPARVPTGVHALIAPHRAYSLVIDRMAVTKGRPRSGKTPSGTVIHYTPAATKAWEAEVGWRFVEAHGHPLLECPVAVELGFFGVAAGADIDNLTKAILDGLNGIAWKDDRQVVELHAIKRAGVRPARTEILVRPVAS